MGDALSYRQTEAARAVIAAALDQPKPTPDLRAALAQWERITTPLPVSWEDPVLRAFAPAHVRVALALRDAADGLTAKALAARVGQADASVREIVARYQQGGRIAHDGGWPRCYRWVGGEIAPPHGATLAILHAITEQGPARAADIAKRVRRQRSDVTRALRALEMRGLTRFVDGRWYLVRMAVVQATRDTPDMRIAA